ncbi:hypothetical protein Q604_UNBC00890G0001, partial [human gut metagenome]
EQEEGQGPATTFALLPEKGRTHS